MHRIDTSGSVAGRFDDGNPAIGQLATLMSAPWFNDVQENLCHVIEQAGIELEKGNYDQLREAIIATATGVAGDGDGGVPTTRQISTSGLASGGGDLVADRTINVPKATAAEAAAGIRDDVAVTPAGLAAASGLILNSGSTLVFRMGPVILQVFSATLSRRSSNVVSLPMAFSTKCVAGFINAPDSWHGPDDASYVSALGLTSVTVWADHWGWTGNLSSQLLVIGI